MFTCPYSKVVTHLILREVGSVPSLCSTGLKLCNITQSVALRRTQAQRFNSCR